MFRHIYLVNISEWYYNRYINKKNSYLYPYFMFNSEKIHVKKYDSIFVRSENNLC